MGGGLEKSPAHLSQRKTLAYFPPSADLGEGHAALVMNFRSRLANHSNKRIVKKCKRTSTTNDVVCNSSNESPVQNLENSGYLKCVQVCVCVCACLSVVIPSIRMLVYTCWYIWARLPGSHRGRSTREFFFFICISTPPSLCGA